MSQLASSSSVELEVFLGRLPGEVGIGASEVSKSCRLLINGPLQVEFLDDVSGAEAEVVPYDSLQVGLSATSRLRPVTLNVNREGVRERDRITNLH